MNPKVEGVLVAHNVLHDLKRGGVSLGLEHLPVLPFPAPVGGEVAGGLCAPARHKVLDVPGDGLNAGVVLPASRLRHLLKLFKEHLDRAEVRRETLIEPYVFNDGLLLVGEAREGRLLLGLPA